MIARECLTYRSLLSDHLRDLEVVDSGVDAALHEGAAVVVLDEAGPLLSRRRHVLGEALLFEVADRIVVGVGEKGQELLGLQLCLQVVHEVRSVALHLLVGSDGAERNLNEAVIVEGVEADAAHDHIQLEQH